MSSRADCGVDTGTTTGVKEPGGAALTPLTVPMSPDDEVEAMTLGHRVCVLRDGRLQQADTPQALFETPVNLFVAGFMGSPAMNFVMAGLARDDGPVVSFAGYRLPVPASVFAARPGLDGYFGRKIILGIRPSDFEDASLADSSWPRLPVTAGRSMPRRSSTPASARQWPRPRATPRASPRWPTASRCGPRGCPHVRRSGRASPPSSPSTASTCSSSTPAAACPSATLRRPPLRPSPCMADVGAHLPGVPVTMGPVSTAMVSSFLNCPGCAVARGGHQRGRNGLSVWPGRWSISPRWYRSACQASQARSSCGAEEARSRRRVQKARNSITRPSCHPRSGNWTL